MKCNHLLSWAALLVATGPFLAHPITDSAEMPYPGAVSVEDHGMGRLDDLSLSEQGFSPQDVAAALRFSTLLSGDLNRDDLRTGLLPRAMKTEVFLEKPSVLSPLSHVLGIRKLFRKRAGTSDCFWKYCV